MGRKKNQKVWKHFTDKGDTTECNFCMQSYKSKNVNKFQNHLLNCMHCPDVIKSQLRSDTLTEPRGDQSESESDSSSVSRGSSRASTPVSRPGTPSATRHSTPKPIGMFLDRMTEEENVRRNVLFNFYIIS